MGEILGDLIGRCFCWWLLTEICIFSIKPLIRRQFYYLEYSIKLVAMVAKNVPVFLANKDIISW